MSNNVVEAILGSKDIAIAEMAKAGVSFGHRASKWNPQMKPFLKGTRGAVHIIDLEQTFDRFFKALNFIADLIKEDKTILFVGTRSHARQVTEKMAKEIGMPYIVERWMGGTFTNFSVIAKRLEYFRELEKKIASGELDKYTKKERLLFLKELQYLTKKWGGLKDLTKLPEAIFVVDAVHDKLAIKEAKAKGVKVVALCDSNADPNQIDYPIPANDDAVSSLNYIFGKIIEVVKKVKNDKSVVKE